MSTTAGTPRLLSMRPVLEERDDEAWVKDGFDWPEEVAEWRMAGFSRKRAAEWVGVVREIVARDEDVDDDDHETPVAVAAACVAAGFTPEQVGEWGRALPWASCRDFPLQAAEWRAAGFEPARAQEWAQTEPLADAVVLANGGWSPAERDLLDAWLTVHHPQGVSEHRRALVTFGLPPGHALDYARAGVGLDQVAYLERLRREGRDLGAQLCDEAAGSLDFAEAARLDELVDRLDPLRSGLHAQRLLRRPGRMRHTPKPPLALDFPEPAFRGLSWNSHGGDTWTREYGEWEGYMPPEDSACPPLLDWTEEHEKLVQAAFARDWDHIGADARVRVSWPPEPSLWSEGVAHEGEITCPAHDDEYWDGCPSCEDPARQPDRVEPAVWHWSVTAETVGPDYSGDPLCVHIYTTEMDPRDVEYREG